MRLLVKLYSASCILVLGLFVVLQLPLDRLPFSDGVNLIVVGLLVAGFAIGFILYLYRREGFELGWFLTQRGGFWIFGIGVLGIAIIVCGLAVAIRPHQFMPAIERGALPFGVAIVALFWLALIYIFGYLTVGMAARAVAAIRIGRVSEAGVNALVTLLCLGLATLFFSLYVDVLNDLLLRIGDGVRSTAILAFAGVSLAAGIVFGILKEPSYHLDLNHTNENMPEGN